jgi:hypothetical protein
MQARVSSNTFADGLGYTAYRILDCLVNPALEPKLGPIIATAGCKPFKPLPRIFDAKLGNEQTFAQFVSQQATNLTVGTA